MGISGLLPLLKDIQTHKHLSEFRGQTLAVDGYVWLHRGSYGCAPELVTGKPTHKYVDYAMHRVRLLRHHGIQPYLVFDGGPLPAKQGTESERKQRREENLSRANALAAQGKHSQAREYYVKCVDVTPQMAYQLIKVLRAEGVPYIVAPYEADAQLAYLERIGLVDGIITEDSDLLVFGCKTVLYKLDTAASTVTCISRADFASVASTSVGGLSLVGWSDAQFRTMAILSGCDYLPSIPGIGLKTAWTLLRKHKTVENMISALRLEGKKKIPKDYLDAFRLAEKVFLYQRVYDPTQERLVHLTPLPDGEPWDAEKEAYVGGHIEPSLAKRVAQGDACPITLLPMEDINPSFVPRALKAIPMNALSVTPASHRPDKGKSRAKDPAPTPGKPSPAGPLFKFFSPQVAREAARSTGPGSRPASLGSVSGCVRVSPKAPSAGPSAMVVGKKSGKRTLAEVMQEEMTAKRKKHDGDGAAAATAVQDAAGRADAAPTLSGAVPMRTPATSKFFHPGQRSVSDPRGARGWTRAHGAAATPPGSHPLAGSTSGSASASMASPGAGPSGLSQRERASEHAHMHRAAALAHGKENIPCDDGDDDADVLMHEPDAVEQEDGYLSPSPSLAQWDSPDISSPVRPGPSAGRRKPASWDEDDHNADDDDDFFDADVLSSPPLHRHLRQSASTSGSVTVERTVTRALPLVPLRAPRFGSGGSTHTSRRTTTSSRTTSTDSFDSRHGHGPNGRQEREGREDADRNGPDLRDTFDDWEEVTSGGEDEEWFAAREGSFHSTASSTPGPVTPSEPEDAGADEDGDVKMMRAPSRCAADEGSSEELEEEFAEGMHWDRDPGDLDDAIDLSDSDNDQRAEAAARNASTKVAHGWWAKWARSGTSADGLHSNAVGGASASGGSSDRVHEHAQLRRRETTITPDGRQRPLGRTIAPPGWGPRSAPPLAKRTGSLTHEGEDLRATGRTRLTFTASTDVVVTGATPSKVGRSSSLKLKAQAQAHAQSRSLSTSSTITTSTVERARPGRHQSSVTAVRRRSESREEADLEAESTAAAAAAAGTTVSSRNRSSGVLEQYRWTPACR